MNIVEFKDIIRPFIPAHSWAIDIDGELLRIRIKDSIKEFTLSEQELDAIYDRIKKNKSGITMNCLIIVFTKSFLYLTLFVLWPKKIFR